MRLIPLGVAVLVGLAASAIGAPGAVATPTAHAVMISGFAFEPAALTIHAGDSVTWTNHDTAPHDVTVTSGPATVHSPTITTRQSWSYTFATVGSYAYICSVHPDMHATLSVAAVPSPPVAAATAAPPTPTRPSAAPQVAATVPVPPARPEHVAVASGTPRRAAVSSAGATSSSAPVVAAPVAASGTPSHPLKPLLLVAGIVAAVATFCLLLLASRSDAPAPG